MVKRQVDYHEVTVTFFVSNREAMRATSGYKGTTKERLRDLIENAFPGSDTNSLDVEDLRVNIK
jgi:hypothetical protein